MARARGLLSSKTLTHHWSSQPARKTLISHARSPMNAECPSILGVDVQVLYKYCTSTSTVQVSLQADHFGCWIRMKADKAYRSKLLTWSLLTDDADMRHLLNLALLYDTSRGLTAHTGLIVLSWTMLTSISPAQHYSASHMTGGSAWYFKSAELHNMVRTGLSQFQCLFSAFETVLCHPAEEHNGGNTRLPACIHPPYEFNFSLLFVPGKKLHTTPTSCVPSGCHLSLSAHSIENFLTGNQLFALPSASLCKLGKATDRWQGGIQCHQLFLKTVMCAA